LRDGLQELVSCFPEHLQSVRGWGLLRGIVIREGSSWTAPQLAKTAIDHGLLLVAAGPSVLRMVPPLTINEREIRELLRRLAATLSSLS
jgi:acetylornithine aminotransferase